MGFSKTIVFVILITLPSCVFSQSFNSGKNRKTYKGLKGPYPHHGIGIKLGDPIAATYRFYLSDKYSFGAEFGKAASGLYNRYFTNEFDNYIESDTFKTSDAAVEYLSHDVKSDLVGQVKFIYHFGKESSGLRFFLGAGWQWKNTQITYTYLYSNATIESTPGTFDRKRLTMGPVVVGGVEYNYRNIPFKAFLDMEYYTDAQIDPGMHRFQGGVGFRYVF